MCCRGSLGVPTPCFCQPHRARARRRLSCALSRTLRAPRWVARRSRPSALAQAHLPAPNRPRLQLQTKRAEAIACLWCHCASATARPARRAAAASRLHALPSADGRELVLELCPHAAPGGARPRLGTAAPPAMQGSSSPPRAPVPRGQGQVRLEWQSHCAPGRAACLRRLCCGQASSRPASPGPRVLGGQRSAACTSAGLGRGTSKPGAQPRCVRCLAGEHRGSAGGWFGRPGRPSARSGPPAQAMKCALRLGPGCRSAMARRWARRAMLSRCRRGTERWHDRRRAAASPRPPQSPCACRSDSPRPWPSWSPSPGRRAPFFATGSAASTGSGERGAPARAGATAVGCNPYPASSSPGIGKRALPAASTPDTASVTHALSSHPAHCARLGARVVALVDAAAGQSESLPFSRSCC